MDILARIEEVIKERGLGKAEVAERMSIAKQNFKSLLTNPKWSAVEKVCQAVGIEPWQLFEQEIRAAGYCLTAEQELQGAEEEPSAAGAKETTDDLPTGNDTPEKHEREEQRAEEKRVLCFAYDCPHCGHEVKITIE